MAAMVLAPREGVCVEATCVRTQTHDTETIRLGLVWFENEELIERLKLREFMKHKPGGLIQLIGRRRYDFDTL